MSRSYKKHASFFDHKGKAKKRIANSHVRSWLKHHPEVTLKGKKYKCIHERWDICDYGSLYPFERDFHRQLQHYQEYLNGGFPHYVRWYGTNEAPDRDQLYKEWVVRYKVK